MPEAVRNPIRHQLAAQANGAQSFPPVFVAQRFKFRFNKAIIKTYVVRYKNAAFGHIDYFLGYFVKLRRIGHHIVGNIGELGEVRRNVALGIDERRKFIHYLQAIVHKNADLGDPSAAKLKFSSAGLNINNGEQPCKVKVERCFQLL